MLCQARALYDYDATKEDELTIREGDVIDVTERFEDGWWYVLALESIQSVWWALVTHTRWVWHRKGRCNGHEGIFPESYVEVV